MSDRDTWATSPELYAVIDDIWHPTLDVCASAGNVKCPYFYTEEMDALKQPWVASGYYFCNAPGSKIAAFVEKAIIEQQCGAAGILIFQAGISSRWFVDLCRCAVISPLTPRIQFVPPPGVPQSSNTRDWMLAVVEPWMLAVPSVCGIGHPLDWEEVGIARGVLVRPKPGRRAVVAV